MSIGSRERPCRIAAAVAVLATALCHAAPALAAGAFAPHRAIYEMKLETVHRGSGIAAVAGSMAVQWERDCQGWTFDHRSELDIGMAEGPALKLATHASSWESADGRRYSFTLRHVTNGKESERVEGAARTGPDGAGTVTFTRPEPHEIALPKGTLFPVAHSELLLSRAARLEGSKAVSRMVFDGMGDEGAFEVNAILTPARGGRPASGAAAPLAGLGAFNATIAYFTPGAAMAEPKHEMAMRIYANGVADNMLIDFDEFSVRATLARLEMLEAPACGR